jgi:hypothetical protein
MIVSPCMEVLIPEEATHSLMLPSPDVGIEISAKYQLGRSRINSINHPRLVEEGAPDGGLPKPLCVVGVHKLLSQARTASHKARYSWGSIVSDRLCAWPM